MEITKQVSEKIDQVARLLYRQSDPKKFSIVSRDIVINSLLIVAIIGGVFLLWNKFQDSQNRPVIEIEPGRWSVVVGKNDEACWTEATLNDCLAKPDNKELWTSPLKRRSPEYFQALESDLKQAIWMGVEITPAELKKAHSAGASRLMLGLLYSRYEVWVDGERIQLGDYLENDLPISLDLSAQRMQADKTLKVALAVVRDGKMRTIDSDWFVPKMGLFTAAGSEQQARWVAFSKDTRFYALFAMFFIFGLIFRHAARIKEINVEYPAAAALSFVLAVSEFIGADSSFRLLGPQVYYPVFNATLAAEAMAVLGFGLAFSRCRTELLKLVHALIPIVFIVFFILAWVVNDDGALTEKMLGFLTPAAYMAAGVTCLLQYLALKINDANLAPTSKRRSLLATMSLVFIVMAVIFVGESMQARAVESHWIRTLAVVPLFILATAIAGVVRKNYRIIETTAISAFHQMSPLPESVGGVIINLDLKASERLYRTGAHEDVGGTIVSTVLSQIWGRFVSTGATVMQSSGDDLLMIYPESALREDPLLWLKTLQSAHDELQLIARQLADTQPELVSLKAIEYRAAVVKGAVRPLWRMIGTTRVPSWVEAGSKNAFVDTSRLLELERSTKAERQDPAQQGSALILDATLADDLKLRKQIQMQQIVGEVKHGRSYQGFIAILNSKLN